MQPPQVKATPEIPGQPVSDHILVLPDAPITHSPEGVEIPKGSQIQPKMGLVVAVGPEIEKNFPEIKIGCRLLWLYDVSLDGKILEHYVLLTSDDVGLIFEDNHVAKN